MMKEIDLFYLQKDEPLKSCLLYLREHILAFDKNITEAWKYRMPFFCYNGRMFCYVWVHTKTFQPYIGFVEGKFLNHPDLIFEKRARIKIMLMDADKDVPVNAIDTVLQMAIRLYDK